MYLVKMEKQVSAWSETITIPTYLVGKSEKNPVFLENRVYQGSSGVIYPHPIIEKIEDEKVDKEYQVVFIENDYLKVMIMPELGGRVQRAYDKIRKRDFIYYNQVIKPALVGLTGPWISGGIEFNWPQHHRPSTFQPVDSTIEHGPDGSITVWVNEVEAMFRTKGMAGFTLYPDKAYLEVKGKLFNRTPFPQTFLWWANPAVKVNDYYQSIFPPDVYAVFDHGKREVSDFPIATGTYYKVDYSPGTDISLYKNIPVPTSYMAIASKFDFIGSYEHDTNAGMLHVANHHVSTGKKQWTWGDDDFGYAWDRNLTDEDGPYIELMTGMFTDNQPDFSWLQPNEEKTFEQYFMPFAQIGGVKNASKEALLNMDMEGQSLSVKVYATSVYKQAKIKVFVDSKEVESFTFDLSPENVFEQIIQVKEGVNFEQIKVVVETEDGQELVSHQAVIYEEKEVPPPATAAKKPSEITSIEELYINGLHLEQYRHATFNPIDYYEEALSRESGDIRCNNAMGLLLLRRGQFVKAEPYFRTAIATMTSRNPNPYNGEVYYNLGCCLQLQGNMEDAFDAFYKSVWNDAFQHSGYLSLARIAITKKPLTEALILVDKSLIKNYHSHSARHLKAVILRKMNQLDTAKLLIEESLKIDPFNYGCWFEKYLIFKSEGAESEALNALSEMKALMNNSVQNYLEYSLDYGNAGLFAEASDLLKIYLGEETTAFPMVFYYLGWFALQMQNPSIADQYFKQAAIQKTDYCFPSKIEEIIILKSAIKYGSEDAKAYYYLGNLWYAKRQYTEAISCWEQSVTIDNKFATVHRNLSLAYHNKLNDPQRALKEMEMAFSLDSTDARVLMELDQLYKLLNRPYQSRLDFLNQYISLVNERDDLYLERVTLLNCLGEFGQVKDLMANRKFHPCEGGEGKVVGQFLICHLELAKIAIAECRFADALSLLNFTDCYPHNLGEGKLPNAQENDIHYLKACAYEGLGDGASAKRSFEMATIGISTPVQAIFYNDPQPDKIFYQGLAWRKLGDDQKATEIFTSLITFAEQHINDLIEIDYFAVSLPDLLVFDQDLNVRNHLHCIYLKGLAELGLGNYTLSESHFTKVLKQNINHQGVLQHQHMQNLLKQLQDDKKNV